MDQSIGTKKSPWSQVIFFKRENEEIETLVEGYLEEKLVITRVSYMDTDKDLVLSPKEQQEAREYLYDSIMSARKG